jgi:hypothetical protein
MEPTDSSTASIAVTNADISNIVRCLRIRIFFIVIVVKGWLPDLYDGGISCWWLHPKIKSTAEHTVYQVELLAYATWLIYARRITDFSGSPRYLSGSGSQIS